MAKYRLSYKTGNVYRSIDLSLLDCLEKFDVTDLSVIDKFTANFNDLGELLKFLKKNSIIRDDINQLFITVDKKDKETGNNINKKIYNGHKLIFKDDYRFINVSFIYKWLSYNKYDPDLVISICDNYLEKYQNAKDRIEGSSYILCLFSTLKKLAYDLKYNRSEMSAYDFNNYRDCIDDFLVIEFFKIDKKVLRDERRIVKKIDKNGKHLKQYRNIHDFVLFLQKLNENLDLYISDRLSNENDLEISDNFDVGVYSCFRMVTGDEAQQSIGEEFLTPADFKEDQIPNCNTFSPYRDGHDYIVPESAESLRSAQLDIAKKLSLKPGDGYKE